MKTNLIRQQAQEKIDEFFKREEFTLEEVRKIKRLAMKFNIKLLNYKRLFCKKCLLKLRGKIKINKSYRIIKCSSCGYENKIKNRK